MRSGLAKPMTLAEGAPEPRTAADDRDAVAATQAQGIAPAAGLFEDDRHERHRRAHAAVTVA